MFAPAEEEKTYTMLCIEEFTELQRKLKDIEAAMGKAKSKDPSDRNMGRDFMYDVEEILEDSELVKNSER